MGPTQRPSRPLHPCVLSLTPESTASPTEFSCWLSPTLVATACNTTVVIYYCSNTNNDSGTAQSPLQLRSTHVLQGSVIGLYAIPQQQQQQQQQQHPNTTTPALLLVAVAKSRLALIQLDAKNPALLPAISIADLGGGDDATTAAEDMIVSVQGSIIACSWNGGERIAVLQVHYPSAAANADTAFCTLGEPYMLSTSSSSSSGDHLETTIGGSSSSSSLPGGHIRDILVVAGWEGFIEGAIVVVLHSTMMMTTDQESCAVTALTVSTAHQRTAVLWTTKTLDDAWQLQQQQNTNMIMVVGVNGLQWLDTAAGRVRRALPVNGWATVATGSSSSNTATDVSSSQQQPLLRLAIALDASRWLWLGSDTALVVLRRGHVYWLVRQEGDEQGESDWVLLPTGYSLELCGEVASLSLRPSSFSTTNDGTTKRPVVLCGSRLGDSFLLQLELESTNVPIELVEARNRSQSKTIVQFGQGEDFAAADRLMYQQDDKELYHLVSDDDDSGAAKRRKKDTWLVLRSLTAMDRLSSLAPLGPLCRGHVTLVPTGYGRSGGVALLTRPGQDERCIVTEQDVLHVECISSSATDFVCLGMVDKGIQVLWRNGTAAWEQVDEDFCRPTLGDGTGAFSNALDVFRSKLLLSSVLPTSGQTVMVVRPVDTQLTCLVVTSVPVDRKIDVVFHHTLEHDDSIEVVKLTEVVEVSGESFAMGCIWSNGQSSYVAVDMKAGTVVEKQIPPLYEAMEVDVATDDEEDEETQQIRQFYSDTATATAVDMFRAPNNIFYSLPGTPSNGNAEPKTTGVSDDPEGDDVFDEFDRELYGIPATPKGGSQDSSPPSPFQDGRPEGEDSVFVAVTRKSGDLEVYEVKDSGQVHELKWSAKGLALGMRVIQRTNDDEVSQPRTLPCASVTELCFFVCSSTQHVENGWIPRFCLALHTSNGDIALYTYTVGSDGPFFLRHRLHTVTRTSGEQGRHHKKLVRKKIVTPSVATFSYNVFHRFKGISNQNGLVALCARPFWIISSRGYPVALYHRLRHAAPAGGSDTPVRGICNLSDGSLFTVHERVGRVGSQRLTLFSGIFPPTSYSTVVPGGGFIVEKIPLGVTVRKVVYIGPDASSTGGDGPLLYAMLVSQEEELDQSKLNSDGLTDEQRQKIQMEKESSRIRKQVEADLGGFDIESEWVEEIERVDRLEVNTDIGGAPPLHQPNYSLWIVDANDGWKAVDSFQLDEFEHGIDLAVMDLSVFKDETGASTSEDEELEMQQFVVVGTGIVNADGEDVATKGRALLFSVKRPTEPSLLTPVADLSLAYEKNIFHGPVTTVSCLSSEGKNRLVIGAGSDVNIEQWGNDKLTQVGFYRAKMHVLVIKHFKNFLILADAYDSFYFLVWRESDKSITLLAKEYDPIPVYAVGTMTRGSSLTFVCHDNRENFQFFQYAPGEAAARGGNKLVCRADFHLGETTTSMSNFSCLSSLLVHSATPTSTHAALKQQEPGFGRQDDDQKRVGIYFGTAGGSLGGIVAVKEDVYWHFLGLQSVVANAVESDAALSPRAWRHYVRSTHRHGCRSGHRKKDTIDGDLVLKFAELSIPEQEDLASAIGTTAEVIMDHLVELQCASSIL